MCFAIVAQIESKPIGKIEVGLDTKRAGTAYLAVIRF